MQRFLRILTELNVYQRALRILSELDICQKALGILAEYDICQRLLRILTAFDIFVFAIITLGDSRRNETISGACWSLEQDNKMLGKLFRPIVDFLLSPIEKNHCYVSWLAEYKTYRK